jgi:type IV secretory pathway TrbL component
MKSPLSGSSGTSKMKLTEKEQKVARLAFDKAAQPGERQAAAAKLIESLSRRADYSHCGSNSDDSGRAETTGGHMGTIQGSR